MATFGNFRGAKAALNTARDADGARCQLDRFDILRR